MSSVRRLAERDLPAVAALFVRVHGPGAWPTQAALADYFRQVLFANPWVDPQIPSWVAEAHGQLVALQAVVPRPMSFRGRRVRVAVSTQFMVDRARADGLTAFHLIKACLSGPQDLTLADGVNDEARKIGRAMGGAVPLLYSLHWTRPLRPAAMAVARLAERAQLGLPARLAASALARPIDALAARLGPNRSLREVRADVDVPLAPATMLEHWSEVTRPYALVPAYDPASLVWLLDQAAAKRRHGALRSRAVCDRRQGVLGWFHYYLRGGDVGEVLQIVARNGAFERVLRVLLADAWRRGAIGVHGRLEPHHAQELSDAHCWMRREGTWTVVHSRDPALAAAFHDGTAFLSRLEGEWWLRFHDAPIGVVRRNQSGLAAQHARSRKGPSMSGPDPLTIR